MINIFKKTEQNLENRYLGKRYEHYLKINAKYSDRYNNIKFMGIDGQWHNTDYSPDVSNEENVRYFLSLMPTRENIENNFGATAELPRNFETAKDFAEIELDLSSFDKNDRDAVREIILETLSKPNIEYWPNHKEEGIRPLIALKENKILAFNRTLSSKDKSFSIHTDFSSPEYHKSQCQQINKALKEAGYSYRVKASIMDYNEPSNNNNSELENINKENESLRKEISEMKKNYNELAESAKSLFTDDNSIGNRVAKKKEENRNKSLTLS